MTIDPAIATSLDRLPTRRQALKLLAGVGLLPFLPRFARDRGLEIATASALGTWVGGGTAAMTAKDTYPNPFTSIDDSCLLVASTTEGPCTTATDLMREDISEGWSGLPVRLALKVVDSSCTPVTGAIVKVWHTNIEGSYSGQTPNNGMCLKSQAYSSANFFRGVQTTADDGTVFFDTCFPGWYRGRAVHIHFQVKDATRSYRVSQLFFPEDITEDVFASHDEYAGYGQPDTVFTNDNVISAIASSQRNRHLLGVSQMSDGAMLASKVVTVTEQAVAVTPTPRATATATPTASPTPPASSCVGDCDASSDISVDELVRGINIALGNESASSCEAFDVDGSGSVTIDEILAAVNAALTGCS